MQRKELEVMDKELIVALDFANGQEVEHFLKPFGNQKLFLKVGMELSLIHI